MRSGGPAVAAVASIVVSLVTQPAPAQQTPQFRAAVDRVRVDVVVTDSSDRPIAGLTKDDFTIVENGRPQTITDFRFVSVPVATRAVDSAEARTARPDVATNAMSSPSSRLWAIVVDDLHLIEADVVAIKKTLTDIVLALPPEDDVAMVYVGRSNLGVNFKTGLAGLLKTIDNVRAALGFGLDAYPEARNPAGYIVAQATRTSDTLRNVASTMAGSGHPRRAIIYVGSMTTIDPESEGGISFINMELVRTFDQAKRSDVPIYTIDPRGPVLPEDAVRGATSAILTSGIRSRIARNIRSQQGWMSVLAINTGGRAFTNNSDLTRAVHEIVGENGSFYELAYSPAPLVADGKFHDFDVKVNRPGVRVRARQGYMAPGATAESAPLKVTTETAMAAGVDVLGLTLRASATPIAPAEKGMQTAVTIEVTYPAPVDGSRRIEDTLAVSIYALDADAKIKQAVSRQVRLDGRAPDDRDLTIVIDDAVDLPSERLTLRIGVASQQLGRAGTVQMPIDVTRPSDGRLQLSGIAIGVAGASAPVINASSIAPLVPFQPTTSRTFASADMLRVFGRAFWKSRDPVAVTMTVKGLPSASPALALQPFPGVNGGQAATFDAPLPLKDLAPGAYMLEITARLKSGAPVIREIPFAIR